MERKTLDAFVEIPGFPGYRADRYGEIMSFNPYRNRPPILLTQSANVRSGYLYVWVRAAVNEAYSKRVHVLILETFVGPRPQGYVAAHLDGDKVNNRLENLRWVTQKENYAPSVGHGTNCIHERHGLAKLTWKDVWEIRADTKSLQADLAKKYNVSMASISNVKTHKCWREQ